MAILQMPSWELLRYAFVDENIQVAKNSKVFHSDLMKEITGDFTYIDDDNILRRNIQELLATGVRVDMGFLFSIDGGKNVQISGRSNQFEYPTFDENLAIKQRTVILLLKKYPESNFTIDEEIARLPNN